jgi:hypothetical protein
MLGKKVASFSARCSSSRHAVARCSVWSCVRSRETSFADARLIPKSCVIIAWHMPNDKLSSWAISLIVKRRFPRITVLTQSTVLLVRAATCVWIIVDGRAAILNREYRSYVLDRLSAVSPNACCRISYVSVAVLPSFWRNLMQTRCSFNTSVSQYYGGTNTIAL